MLPVLDIRSDDAKDARGLFFLDFQSFLSNGVFQGVDKARSFKEARIISDRLHVTGNTHLKCVG